MPSTLKDKILIRRSEAEDNIINNDSLASDCFFGETLLCYENGKERLYTKNQDGNVVPLHRFADCGEIEVVINKYSPEEAPNGVYVYANDGQLYIPDLWNTENNNNAVGVAIITDNTRLCVKKELDRIHNTNNYWSLAMEDTDIPSISNSFDDYNGLNNTTIIRELSNNEDSTNNFSHYCYSKTITINGNEIHGYLPAFGELSDLYKNKSVLDNTLTLIGGKTLSITDETLTYYYASSTEHSGYASTEYFGIGWNSGGESYGLFKGGSLQYVYIIPCFPIIS